MFDAVPGGAHATRELVRAINPGFERVPRTTCSAVAIQTRPLYETKYYVARPMTRIAQPGCILAGSGRVGHTRRGGRPAP